MMILEPVVFTSGFASKAEVVTTSEPSFKRGFEVFPTVSVVVAFFATSVFSAILFFYSLLENSSVDSVRITPAFEL